jgi:FHA domain
MQQGMPGAPGAPGAPPGAAGPLNPNPPIITKGMWFWTKKFCTQCEKQLDRNWFQCPYCAQAAQEQAAAAAKNKVPMKTQAFMIGGGLAGSAGAGGPAGTSASGMQMIGWLVPLAGAQRGELYTLGSLTTIGTDPAACNLVLGQGQFISSKHAEIKVEAGSWMLKDVGSTNGTYVNDKRVEKTELVDNDLVKFGQCLCRFKSL